MELEAEHTIFHHPKGEEERWEDIGIINGRYVVAFYTMHGTKNRIICLNMTLRKIMVSEMLYSSSLMA